MRAISNVHAGHRFPTPVARDHLDQRFPPGEEFLPREEFHVFRGGMFNLFFSCLFIVSVVVLF